MVQIGAGWAKGMRCTAPEGEKTRPTSARVRAAVLNMLQDHVENARVLDLFAGSGAIGIEALSRGAGAATFVEKAPAAIAALKKNLTEMERRALAQGLPPPRTAIMGADVGVAVERLSGQHSDVDGAFELIYVDPPYRDVPTWLTQLGPRLAQLCIPGGWLIIESSTESGELVPPPAHFWVLVKRKTYGDTMITIWERR